MHGGRFSVRWRAVFRALLISPRVCNTPREILRAPKIVAASQRLPGRCKEGRAGEGGLVTTAGKPKAQLYNLRSEHPYRYSTIWGAWSIRRVFPGEWRLQFRRPFSRSGTPTSTLSWKKSSRRVLPGNRKFDAPISDQGQGVKTGARIQNRCEEPGLTQLRIV